MIPLPPLAKIKLGRVAQDQGGEDEPQEATLQTLDARIGGMEQRLERLQNILQALAGKFGAEISH